jgi:hypothetical protein
VSKIVHIVRVRTADVAGNGATPTAIGIFFLSSFSFNAYHCNDHSHINSRNGHSRDNSCVGTVRSGGKRTTHHDCQCRFQPDQSVNPDPDPDGVTANSGVAFTSTLPADLILSTPVTWQPTPLVSRSPIPCLLTLSHDVAIRVVLTRTVPTELVPVDPASAAPIKTVSMDVVIDPVCIMLATTVPIEPVPVDSTLVSFKPISCDIRTDPAHIPIAKSVPADPMPVDPVLVSYIDTTSAPVNSTHVTALVNPILADPDPDALGALVYPVCITPLTPVHDDLCQSCWLTQNTVLSLLS